MDVIFADDDDLDSLEKDESAQTRFADNIVKAFRRRMQQIRDAKDERDLWALRSLNFEKLKGKRIHEHSLRLNDQWRLIVEIEKGNPKNTLRIKGIEDYHH